MSPATPCAAALGADRSLSPGPQCGMISASPTHHGVSVMRNRCLACWVLVPVVALIGCAGGSIAPSTQPSPRTGPGVQAHGGPASSRDLIPAVVGIPNDAAVGTTHRITAGDVLEIQVFQVDDLSTTERVNEAGAIALPLVGAVPVAGLTIDEAERRIAGALAKDYLQDPQIDVFVSEYANLEVSIGGEVEKPGVFPIRGRTTLLDGIALAGGTTRRAKEEQVIVFRTNPASSGIDAYVVNLKKIQRGELGDPLLAANDKVVVPKSGTRVFLEDVRDMLRGFVSLNPLLY